MIKNIDILNINNFIIFTNKLKDRFLSNNLIKLSSLYSSK